MGQTPAAGLRAASAPKREGRLRRGGAGSGSGAGPGGGRAVPAVAVRGAEAVPGRAARRRPSVPGVPADGGSPGTGAGHPARMHPGPGEPPPLPGASEVPGPAAPVPARRRSVDGAEAPGTEGCGRLGGPGRWGREEAAGQAGIAPAARPCSPSRRGPGRARGRERPRFEAISSKRQWGWERGTATRRVIKQTNEQTSTGRAVLRGRELGGDGPARCGGTRRGPAPPPRAGQTLTKGKRGCVRAAVNQSRRKDTAGKQAPFPAPARPRTGRYGRARLPQGRAGGCSPARRSHGAGAPRLGPSTVPATAERPLSPPAVRGAGPPLVPAASGRRAGRGGAAPFPRAVGREAPGRCPPPPRCKCVYAKSPPSKY